jgi:AcrR family transcriptional regulator
VPSDPPGGSPEQPDELARLPRGRHGLPEEFVAHNQRERLIVSLAHVVAEHGYNDTTITRIVEGAGVTSRTFYKYFQTVEECYLAALDSTIARLTPLVVDAYQSEQSWPLRVRASIAAVLDFFAAEPEIARLCAVEPFVAGPGIARRYELAIDSLVPYLRLGRELREGSEAFPETTERGLLGSMNSLVARKVSAGEAESLPQLLPDLVQFALTPYLGAGEARRIAIAASAP